ncbi:LSU ribosomal protein L29p (L35e) [Clostridiaceae bacterium JG1575]|nr:LSU ribosomal protein L29p (L35e) [Clostridiaceae bacterium JG1575]
MKIRDLNDIRHNAPEDLEARLLDLKKELFNLRFQLSTGQLENPARIKDVKKSIAQIKTVLREQEVSSIEQ